MILMRPFPFSRFAFVNFDDRYDQKHCKQHTAIIQWASGPSARFLSFLRRFIAHRQVPRFLFTKQLAQNLHFCLLPSSCKKLADAASCIFFFRCAEPVLNDFTVLFPLNADSVLWPMAGAARPARIRIIAI